MKNPVDELVGSKLASNVGSSSADKDDTSATTPRQETAPAVAMKTPETDSKPAALSASGPERGPEAPALINSNGSVSFSGQQRQVDNNSLSPEELFSKVILTNEKQNKRLSAKYNGGKTAETGHTTNKGTTKMRFIVCTLGLLSLAMSQMSRMVIYQTITQMVDPSMIATRQDDASPPGGTSSSVIETDGSCPWPPEEVLVPDNMSSTLPELVSPSAPPPPTPGPPEIASTPSTTANLDEDQDLEEMPNIDDMIDGTSIAPPGTIKPPPESTLSTTTTKLATNVTANTDNDSHNQQDSYERFKWSVKQQGVIMGGFYYSYPIFMILGGRLAEVYGSKYVILLAVAGSALINLATPWLARTSFAMLVMSRICMGAIQAGVFPAMYALIGKWLTMSEASIYAPLIKMNLRLGMALGSLIPGIIPGWPNVFYFTGFLSVIWSIAWIICASSDPADCKWVSEGELKHIVKKKKHAKQKEVVLVDKLDTSDGFGQQQQQQEQVKSRKRSLKTPWLKIWIAPSVIGLILVKLTMNYALDFLAIELPTYLKYVHHASRQTISAITTPMFGIQVCLIAFVGWFAKVAVQKRPLNLSKTAIRKLFQCTASFGMALCFFLLTFNDCNLTFVAIMLQLISLLSMFCSGGETMLPYDLSEEYPATIMSIANSIATLSGMTTTTLAGIVLGDEGGSYYRWNILIYLIVGANVLGGLAFIFLVKAEPIDFSSSKTKQTKQASQAAIDIESKDKTTGRFEMVEIKLNEPSS